MGGGSELAGSKEYAKTEKAFLQYASVTANENHVQLIFLYYPTAYHLTAGGKLVFDESEEEYQHFVNLCDNHGIAVASTKQEIIRMYREEHVLPNGFANTSLGIGHENEYGHAAMAEAVVDTIRELEAQ